MWIDEDTWLKAEVSETERMCEDGEYRPAYRYVVELTRCGHVKYYATDTVPEQWGAERWMEHHVEQARAVVGAQ